MSEFVLFCQEDGVATLTLNDAARLNPFTVGMQRGILDALKCVRDRREIRALILTASGRGFCVGADLPDFARRSEDAANGSLGEQVGRMLRESANQIVSELKALPVPVVCAINGVAAGGGVGLALAGDMVLAARSAYFYLPFVPALGAVPDMGTSWAMPRSVGRTRAIGLALTGEKLAAHRAVEWGLIWDCVADEELQDQAKKLAFQLAALPAHAIEEVRGLFAASAHNTLSEQLELEAQRQSALIDREEFAEGMLAFNQRRKPSFKGRQ